MAKQQLYIAHGMGSDAVGLVGRITAPIAAAGGNIVDLRQDVLHGLFTIYLAVDLSDGQLGPASLQTILAEISEDTGLSMTVNQYTPVARVSDKKSLLMILIGRDQPGIIATSSKMLGQYNANIEFAQTIGREGIFLMELITDVSHSAIPVDNLKRAVRDNMQELGIATIFQDEQVFNKRKRVILFHISSTFLDEATINEIISQTGIDRKELQATFGGKRASSLATAAADRLEGLPIDVIETVLSAVIPTEGSLELTQTLKVMGYKIVLASTGLSFFTEHLRHRLDLDYAFGIGLEVDNDQRTVTGNLLPDELGADDMNTVLTRLTASEKVATEDITIIADKEELATPGIRVTLNLDVLLDCFNQRIISPENMIGLLGSFGQLHFD
jgi:predicted amino acid-binding ACT domain protein/phosphoserine phosphatase